MLGPVCLGISFAGGVRVKHLAIVLLIGLMLALNRRLHKAYNRVREGNFALDGLLGFDVCGRTVGIVAIETLRNLADEVERHEPHATN